MSNKSGNDAPQSVEASFESKFFVLRTPVLPFDELSNWGKGVEAVRAFGNPTSLDRFEGRWISDVNLLRGRLRDLVDRPEISHALFVASPSLYSTLGNWKRDPNSKKGIQTERALVRYFARMCARSTPFGLFSGCSVGRVAQQGEELSSELVLEPLDKYRPCSRLDFDYLFSLTDVLRKDAVVASSLRYRPNSSLHKIGESWHYVESRIAGPSRSHHLVKVESDEYLENALQRAEWGATLGELAASIVSTSEKMDISQKEAAEYIQELVDNNILVSTLYPLVTGYSPLDDIITQLEAGAPGSDAVSILKAARSGMAAIDAKGIRIAPDEYSAITAELSRLPVKIDPSRLYQIDMAKPARCAVLSREVLRECAKGVELLCRLGKAGEPEGIRAFREAFEARYERAHVPLLEALDDDAGVGFGDKKRDGSPLIQGLGLQGSRSLPASSAVNPMLLRKLLASLQEKKQELELDESDLPPAGISPRFLPDSFSLLATLVGSSTEDVDRGNFHIHLKSAVGPDGARFLGRFCHTDADLENHVREYLKREEAHRSDALYAEIVYLPEGRIGNVLCRPVLREYELVYLGRSGAPPDRQLPLTDLMVALEKSRIIVYSRRLGKEIIPRLTTAHGYLNPQMAAVYRFLCMLQNQGGVGVPMFSWGALESLDFLPRVTMGRLVLATTRWRISAADIKKITGVHNSARFAAIQELRRERGLPRWVLLEESDHTLPVDLDNPLSVDAFVHVLKRGSQAILRELYPDPAQLCVHSMEGQFYHELNVLFSRKISAEREDAEDIAPFSAVQNTDCFPANGGPGSELRTFAPCSEWTYVKLYGGLGSLDEILSKVLSPIIQATLSSGAISRWFFLRYADPHQHLRIRFHGEPERLGQVLLPALSEAFKMLLSSRRIWKVQFDTYDREIERYGGPEAILAAEDIFCADSEAVLEILRLVEGDESLDTRWRAAFLGLDTMLSDFGLDLAAKHSLVKKLCDVFHREFQFGSALKKALSDRLRGERHALRSILGGQTENADEFEWIRKVFAARSARLSPAVNRLRNLEKSGKLSARLDDLLVSYLHMHVNRIVRSSPRDHELVLYDFLCQMYDANLAQIRKPGKSLTERPPLGSPG